MSVFIRLGFLAVFSFCFCASDARIGIRDYCTKNEKFSLWPGIDPSNELASKIPPQYSLFWGTVMFESGFLKSLRLKGNFKKNAETRDNGGTPVIDRRFDKGLDNLEELIIKLFPSNLAETDGQICATWNYMDNLGKFIKELCSKSKEKGLECLAKLMVTAEMYRELSRKMPGELKIEISEKRLRRLFQSGSLIEQAMKDESKYGYAKYTVEHVILAFICELLNKEDVKEFLELWRGLREKIFGTNAGKSVSSDEIAKYAKCGEHIKEQLIKMIGSIPYDAPVENGIANCYEYNSEGQAVVVTDGNFPDCVETSVRHTINYALGTKGMNNFNKEEIRKRVREGFPNQLLKGDRLDALGSFYEQVQDRNRGDPEARTLWNAVVFDLNHIDESVGVRYNPNGKNELKAGFINFVKTICAILGVKYMTASADEITSDELANLLSKLLCCLGGNDVKCETSNDLTYDTGENEFYGKLDIKVTPSLTAYSYEFTIAQRSGHGYVKLSKEGALDYNCFTNNVQDETYKAMVGYLLPDYEGQNLYHRIFSFLHRNDNGHELGSSVSFYEKFEDEDIKNVLKTIIKNKLSTIPLSDQRSAELAYTNVVMGCNFNNDCYKSIRGLVPDKQYFSEDLKKVSLTGADISDISNAEDIVEELRLEDCTITAAELSKLPKLKKLSFLEGRVAIKDLPPSIEELELVYCTIVEAEWSKLSKLKKLSFFEGQVAIKDLPPSTEELALVCCTIAAADWSKLPNLKKLVISGEVRVEICKLPPSLEELELGWDCTIAADPADWLKLTNLKEIKVSPNLKNFMDTNTSFKKGTSTESMITYSRVQVSGDDRQILTNQVAQ